jgi:carbonic anhydrase
MPLQPWGLILSLSWGIRTAGLLQPQWRGYIYSYNLSYLISYITPALEEAEQHAPINTVVKKNAELTAKELSRKSPIINGKLEAGGLKVFSAYYNLSTRVVDFFDANN